MMNEHKYILEVGSKKFDCPKCGKKRFVRYIDTDSGEYLPHIYGRCDREINCSYHLNPYKDGFGKTERTDSFHWKKSKPKPKPVSLIPIEVFKGSLQNHEQNNLITYLNSLLSPEIVRQLVSQYFVGTSKHWQGATVFWQIDLKGKIHTGKIMLYSPDTGKRIKEPFNHITWVHKALKLPEFSLQQCFFGEHLLQDTNKPVAIVESEKTAMIASLYLPGFVWLSIGSLSNLNFDKCNILKGRNVTLFPDLNCYEKWTEKAKQLSHLANFNVSDLLERKATEAEKRQGLDLADYLIRFELSEFSRTANSKPIIEKDEIKRHLDEVLKENNWNKEIEEVESYFDSIELPTHPIKLNKYSTIFDVQLFIKSHIATVKANNGNSTFLPYLNRLNELKFFLSPNKY